MAAKKKKTSKSVKTKKKSAAKKSRPATRKVKTVKKAKKTRTAKRSARAAVKAVKKAPARKKKKKAVVGEGDYQASRIFLKDQSGFVQKNRGRIPELGKAAERALEGPQGDSLRDAEATAAARSRDTF
ncbi:MAG TPA: hypothetical protein VG821_06155 [Rhizomicrobium sp.]|jgi:hypothetical protein|nr:hypothetical protein [Rhizomicrobium sp.]